jgi:hypothetical protein
MKTNCFLAKPGAFLLCTLMAGLFAIQCGYAQKYAKMKVTMNQGVTIEGKKGVIGVESVILFVDGQQQTYPLADVQNIMAKKGSAGKWAIGFGGGCLAIGLAVTAVNPNNDDVGTLALGSVLWAGIFAGLGGLVGLAVDPWKNVYVPKRAALLRNFSLDLGSDQRGNILLGLSYRF